LYTQKFLYFNKLYKNESLLKKDFFWYKSNMSNIHTFISICP
jgi:hypothetical protein